MLSFFVYGGLHSACTAFVFSRTLSSMAGIYLHIPFCKQACHYCDFHFTTSQRGKPELLDAMLREIDLRKEEMSGQVIDTIYFGGGTPSLLTHSELMRFFDAIYSRFEVNPTAEITLEANPDDLSKTQLKMFRDTPVNRFSIGIQSFREQDLKSMNRAHTSAQAERCTLDAADAGFENLSVDLIFGLPDLSMEAWMENVKMALALPITHVSCYGLTIEPKTALAWQINKGMVKIPDDELAAEQYQWLFDQDQVALEFEQPALNRIAENTIKNKTGARGLHSEIERVLMPHMFNLSRYKETGINRLKITESLVNMPTELKGLNEQVARKVSASH
jgi:oxygen-independent coproporphyrinogen-3 oxidase